MCTRILVNPLRSEHQEKRIVSGQMFLSFVDT